MSELRPFSDEFKKIATQEIKEEISNITLILDSCKNDEDISKNSIKIEKHMHNIKGLAPMMGKEAIGSLAKNLDLVLKKIVTGHKENGIFDALCTSTTQMKMNMDGIHNIKEMQNQISQISLKFVN